jgi:hypothetical protein
MTLAEFRERTKRPPLWAWLLFAAILTGLAGHHRSTTLAEQRQLQQEAQTEAERIQRNRQNGAGIADDRRAMDAALAKVEEQLVRASDRAQNLRYFYIAVEEANTSVISVAQLAAPVGANPRAPARAGAFAPVAFQLSVNGQFHNLVGLLASLQRGQHFARINSVSIDRADSGVNAAISLELLGRP